MRRLAQDTAWCPTSVGWGGIGVTGALHWQHIQGRRGPTDAFPTCALQGLFWWEKLCHVHEGKALTGVGSAVQVNSSQ